MTQRALVSVALQNALGMMINDKIEIANTYLSFELHTQFVLRKRKKKDFQISDDLVKE